MVTHSSYSDSLIVQPVAIDERSACDPLHSHEELQQRVRLFLTSSNLPGLRHLVIEVAGDTVVLCGHVRTFYEKQLAIGLSHRVAGIIRVIDRIEVEGYLPRVDLSRGPMLGNFTP